MGKSYILLLICVSVLLYLQKDKLKYLKIKLPKNRIDYWIFSISIIVCIVNHICIECYFGSILLTFGIISIFTTILIYLKIYKGY
jgi:hypothetical protein